MSHTEQAPPAAIAAESGHLEGDIGAVNLVFTVLAYNGPILVFLGFIPVTILLGNGTGTPAMYIFCAVIALLFASGLVAMGLRLPRPGGFYTIVSVGLGKIPGLGTGFTAMACYYAVNVSAYGLGGEAAESLVHSVLGGPDTPWWVYSLVMYAIVTVLGYLSINFSARVLTVFLALELLLLLAYNVSVIVRGGAQGFSLDSFQPSSFLSGSLSIAFIFGIGLFGGFEATIIFRDEVRRPERTIPRATYAVVGVLAITYTLTAWVFINSYGADVILDVLGKNSVAAAADSVRTYTGDVAYFAVSVMLITSSFATILASHNITARYLYNLGVDRVLPTFLGRVHPRFGSPHRASITVSVAVIIGVGAFIVTGVDGNTMYARLSGVYSYCFVILLLVASLAVTAFLLRDRSTPRRPIARAIGTGIAFLFLALALVIATINFELLAGTTGALTVLVLFLIYGLIATGFVLAAVYRRWRPDIYGRIGRDDGADRSAELADAAVE